MRFSHDSGGEVGLRELDNRAILERFALDTDRPGSRTAETFKGRVRAAIHRHRAATQTERHLLDVVADHRLLSEVLSCDQALTRAGNRLSRATVQGTIQAFRAFVAWLPLAPSEREVARQTLERAIRAITKQVGLRRVLTIGATDLHELVVPTADEIERLRAALSALRHALGSITADLVGVCYLTGIRIEAALGLRRRDLVRATGGHWYVSIHEKSRHDRRLVLLRSPDRGRLLGTWQKSLPQDSLWCRAGLRLTYRIANELVDRAAAANGLPHLTFHALRHAFATDIGAAGGFDLAQAAGGWRGHRVAEGYMHPRP